MSRLRRLQTNWSIFFFCHVFLVGSLLACFSFIFCTALWANIFHNLQIHFSKDFLLSPPRSLCLTICFSRTLSSRMAYSTVPDFLLIITWINQMSNWEGNSQDASVQQHISKANIHQCFDKQRREMLFIEMRQFKVSLKYFNNHLTSLYFYSKLFL